MYPHRIRLRGPWEFSGSEGVPPSRVLAPCPREELPAGPICVTRAFGYPGTITAGEHVWLTLSGLASATEVTLNGLSLGTTARDAAYDVTARLGPRNRLELRLPAETPPGPLWHEIALEIRRDAFLRGVTARRRADGTTALSGFVVGTAPRPLDLYVLARRHTVRHLTVTPAPDGAPLRIELTGVPDDCPTLRLELVDGATTWYAVELPIESDDERT